MKTLTVPQLAIDRLNFDYFTLQKQMDALPWHAISCINWPETYPYKPVVSFQIAHDTDCILLHFSVQEAFIKAQYVRSNESVYEDSCVEFFISFDEKVHYYNLEFNVLGTGLIGYGSSVKATRARLAATTIEQVSTATSVVSKAGEKVWNMVLLIPIGVFENENLKSFSGVTAHANFYKCGDMLPTAHFVSWAAIDFPKPNFHLPEFFERVFFE